MVFGDYRMFRALWNSMLLTVGSVMLIVFFSALVAFVMQRRADRTASIVSSIMLAGLIIPPAVVPTIFLLQWLGLYKTLFGLIMVEVAFTMPFATLIFRAFMANIPRELDEAAIIDGASPVHVFFSIILPLLQPAIVTVIVTSSVGIYNDFTGPLYFLPGTENVTAQLTLFSFISQFSSQWNLLFADVVIITIPPLIMFMFFQRQIVSGMTAGAIKG
jgi:raffinose/stachyose/melibiose transport system permease protein